MNNSKILKLILFTIVIFLTTSTSCSSGKYRELNKLSVSEISEKLISELKKGNFTFVENYFDLLLETKETSKNGTKKIDDIYINISKSNKGFELNMFDNWCKNSAHHSANLLKGLYYINDAWRDRGDSYAINVSKRGCKIVCVNGHSGVVENPTLTKENIWPLTKNCSIICSRTTTTRNPKI